MCSPYAAKPDRAFWRRSVAGLPADEVDPVSPPPFRISPEDKVATAGSCFAQHISKTLIRLGFNYCVTEPGPIELQYSVFPARFGNIYTVRQLLQLFDRAYGLFQPRDEAWAGKQPGTFVDPFRPHIEEHGFPTEAALGADRAHHLACVRQMFEGCDVFVFTLGLTEAWVSAEDGAVFPVAPGVSGEGSGRYEFRNFGVEEMTAEMREFLGKLRTVNPGVRLILTVSPVPLIATFEDRHVLEATTYSKSALRVVAESITRSCDNVAYFPSYEIITGAHNRGRFWAGDLRDVTEEGVAHVMSRFARRYLTACEDKAGTAQKADPPRHLNPAEHRRLDALAAIICDEEALDPETMPCA